MKRMIMASVMLLALIPTILIGCAVNYYAQNTIKAEKLDALSGMVHMIDVHLSRYYDRMIHDVQMKSGDDTLIQALEEAGKSTGLNAETQSAVMEILMGYIGFEVLDAALVDQSGKILLSSRTDENGLMLNRTELFRTVIKGNDSYAAMVTVDSQTDLIDIAVPIHDEEGVTIGILKQSVSLDLLYDYLTSLDLAKKEHAFLILRNGSLIYDKERGTPAILYHEYQNNNSLEQVVTAFKTGQLEEKAGFLAFGGKNNSYIGAYDLVDSIGCIAVVATDKEELLKSIIQVKGVILVATIFLLILIAVFWYITGTFHTRPLTMMNSALKKIANGDLTARCSYSGSHEFEELCSNINNLADSYQKNEKELRMSSRIDNLTRLPNRNAIYELLDTLLYKNPNQALLLLELDGFKTVNDSFGYDFGDRILMEAGDILRGLPQHVCYCSRIGGAEFLVFITNWTAPRYPERIAQRIIKKIEGIRFIDEIRMDIGACIGIAYADEERTDKKKLIKYCNLAMHKAKLSGRNSYFVHYSYPQKEM